MAFEGAMSGTVSRAALATLVFTGSNAPASMYLRMASTSPAARGFPLSGMAGDILRATIRYKRLCSLLPGTTIVPLLPPFIMAAQESRSKLPIFTFEAWHPLQFVSKIGCRSLNVGVSADAQADMRKTAAMKSVRRKQGLDKILSHLKRPAGKKHHQTAERGHHHQRPS